MECGHYEFAIPWKALGVVPKAGVKVAFNAFAYQSELDQLKCWEGTDLGDMPSGTLLLK